MPSWTEAFQQIQQENDFSSLKSLLSDGGADINTSIAWDGSFLTPLFVAVLLKLEDHLAPLIACHADPEKQCFYEGFLCCPIHAAALQSDGTMLRTLLTAECDPNSHAETSSMSPTSGGSQHGFSRCNALHVLLIKDIFHEGIFHMLLSYGLKISAPCRMQDGSDVSGLLLPVLCSNSHATEECLDRVIGEEVKHTIRTSKLADALNAFLEMASLIKRKQPSSKLRFVQDINFALDSQSADGQGTLTALIYSAQVGNCEAVRLLLYAGADASITTPRTLGYGTGRRVTLHATAMHHAVLRADLEIVETMRFFGIDPLTSCHAEVHAEGMSEVEQCLMGLSLVHLAVINNTPQIVSQLLTCECDVNAVAFHTLVRRDGGNDRPQSLTPLLLAVWQQSVLCTSALLDCKADVSDRIRDEALRSNVLCEMFGGEPVVGIEDWISALLTGEQALQHLIDRRTDLSRALSWPESGAADFLGRHRLAGRELIDRVVQLLQEVPTVLRQVRPVHLACLFQQPWALKSLAEAGVSVASTPPCFEVPVDEATRTDDSVLATVPLSPFLFSVRMGSLHVVELLSKDPQFALNVQEEISLTPDITPPFFS